MKNAGNEVRHGYESVVTIVNDQMIEKRYTDRYLELNEEYGRIPELVWYLIRPVTQMPELLGYQPDFIKLRHCGRPVQAGGGVIDVPSFTSFDSWLQELDRDLQKAGVWHRDIHGENILIDGDGKFWLIDWAWASLTPDAPRGDPVLADDRSMIKAFRDCIAEDVAREAG